MSLVSWNNWDRWWEKQILCVRTCRTLAQTVPPLFLPKGWDWAPPIPTELLGTPLPQEQGSSQGRGLQSHPNNEPKSACLQIVPEQQTGLGLWRRSIHSESFTPLAPRNKPSLCVIALLPNYLWLTNYLSVNTIYSQSACLWCHTRILILCTALLHFP